MPSVAARIKDYRDHNRETSRLSREAYEDGRNLHGALFLRSADFYPLADDPAKQPARLRFSRTIREVFEISEAARHHIPYGSGQLFA